MYHYKVCPDPPPLLSCLLLFRCQVAPQIRAHRRVHLWRKKKGREEARREQEEAEEEAEEEEQARAEQERGEEEANFSLLWQLVLILLSTYLLFQIFPYKKRVQLWHKKQKKRKQS